MIDDKKCKEQVPAPEDNSWPTKKEIAARYNVSERQIDYLRKKVLPFYVVPSRCIRFDPRKCDQAMKRFARNERLDGGAPKDPAPKDPSSQE